MGREKEKWEWKSGREKEKGEGERGRGEEGREKWEERREKRNLTKKSFRNAFKKTQGGPRS